MELQFLRQKKKIAQIYANSKGWDGLYMTLVNAENTFVSGRLV